MSKKVLLIVMAISLITMLFAACSIGTTECRPTEENTETTIETLEGEMFEGSIPTTQEKETNASTEAPTESEETVPPTEAHTHTLITETIEATCTENGSITNSCECGFEEVITIEAHGHNYQKSTMEPTYTSNGYDVYTCKTCNDSYKDNYKDKIPHEHKNVIQTIAATCTSKGYTKVTCSLCNNEITKDETKALGHDYLVKTISPTAKEKGYDLHTCSRCGNSYKDNYTDPIVTYTEVNETVYANTTVNVRKGPGTSYELLGTLHAGDTIIRIGIGDNGWSKVEYNGSVAYMYSEYVQTTKPAIANSSSYPMTYSDGTCTITIYKEWYQDAYVYAAHLQFSDYSRFGTSCANGSYNNGYETTSSAAKRLGAIFAVNGCYSAPYLDYTVVRSGKIWNGANRNLCLPGIYSSKNGLLRSGWEGNQGTAGISGRNIQELVDAGELTDTFCFGPPGLINGVNVSGSDTSRAQRTFIGTNGNAGDIWVCVSDGRYNDGKSAGLTFSEAMNFLITKGCTYGVHLDGGGSSTMYFNGKVLNAANGNQRAVVDFVYFK